MENHHLLLNKSVEHEISHLDFFLQVTSFHGWVPPSHGPWTMDHSAQEEYERVHGEKPGDPGWAPMGYPAAGVGKHPMSLSIIFMYIYMYIYIVNICYYCVYNIYIYTHTYNQETIY